MGRGAAPPPKTGSRRRSNTSKLGADVISIVLNIVIVIVIVIIIVVMIILIVIVMLIL